MIFMVHTYLDRVAFGAAPDKEAVYAAEIARARGARADGRMLGIFRRADCNGSVFLIDLPSHEALLEELRTLPMFKFWSHVEVLPLVTHPMFPEFGLPREQTGAEPGEAVMPEGY